MSPTVLLFLDYFGIAVFAISGALAAGRNKLDIFGVIVVALVACLGGGTLRDLILNAHPVVWIDNSVYLLLGLSAALATFLLVRLKHVPCVCWPFVTVLVLLFSLLPACRKP